MARAICCDRCEKFYKVRPNETYGDWHYLDGGDMPNPTPDDPTAQRMGIVLCPDCQIAFRKFMAREQTNG